MLQLSFSAPGPAPGPCARAFLIDEDGAIRATLSKILAQFMHIAPVACTARAWQRWRGTQAQTAPDWDLIIVDVSRPAGDGYQVLASCAQRQQGQTVLALATGVTQHVRQQCAALGADAVFDKTSELDALIEYCMALQPARA